LQRSNFPQAEQVCIVTLDIVSSFASHPHDRAPRRCSIWRFPCGTARRSLSIAAHERHNPRVTWPSWHSTFASRRIRPHCEQACTCASAPHSLLTLHRLEAPHRSGRTADTTRGSPLFASPGGRGT